MEFMDEFASKLWSVLKDELFTKFVKTKAAANIASYDTQFRQIRWDKAKKKFSFFLAILSQYDRQRDDVPDGGGVSNSGQAAMKRIFSVSSEKVLGGIKKDWSQSRAFIGQSQLI